MADPIEQNSTQESANLTQEVANTHEVAELKNALKASRSENKTKDQILAIYKECIWKSVLKTATCSSCAENADILTKVLKEGSDLTKHGGLWQKLRTLDTKNSEDDGSGGGSENIEGEK